MSKKKTGTTKATPRPKSKGPTIGQRLAHQVETAQKTVGCIVEQLAGRGVAEAEMEKVQTDLTALHTFFSALPADWKRPALGGKLRSFAVGQRVQIKAKYAEQYDGALPATGLEVVATAGTMVQVKLAGSDAAACAFLPRAHLEVAAAAVAEATAK